MISVVEYIGVVQLTEGSLWQVREGIVDLADIAPTVSLAGITRRRRTDPPLPAPALEEVSDGVFRAELPPGVREEFGRRARLCRNRRERLR